MSYIRLLSGHTKTTPWCSTGLTPTTFSRFVYEGVDSENGSSFPLVELNMQKTIILLENPVPARLVLLILCSIISSVWTGILQLFSNSRHMSIDVFEIGHGPKFRIPFSVTIFDVSVRSDSGAKYFEEEIADKLFNSDIKQLDVIGIVGNLSLEMQATALFPLLSLFGVHVTEQNKCFFVIPHPSEGVETTRSELLPLRDFHFKNKISTDPISYYNSCQNFCNFVYHSNPIQLAQ